MLRINHETYQLSLHCNFSDFVLNFLEAVEKFPDKQIALYPRVSGWHQHANGNWAHQYQELVDALALIGRKPLATFRDVCAGWWPPTRKWLNARPIYNDMIKFCLANNAMVLATASDRLLRPYNYRSNKPDTWQIRMADRDKHIEASRGVPLATLANPDALPSESKSLEIKRGQKAKGAFGGRPHNLGRPKKSDKRCKENWLDLITELRTVGWSDKAIIKRITIESGTNRSSVHRWVKGV